MQPIDTAYGLGGSTSPETQAIVRETLLDVTPRAAALALLRFADYVQLIQQAGVEPTSELCTALFDELKAVCVRDATHLPTTVDGD